VVKIEQWKMHAINYDSCFPLTQLVNIVEVIVWFIVHYLLTSRRCMTVVMKCLCGWVGAQSKLYIALLQTSYQLNFIGCFTGKSWLSWPRPYRCNSLRYGGEGWNINVVEPPNGARALIFCSLTPVPVRVLNYCILNCSLECIAICDFYIYKY